MVTVKLASSLPVKQVTVRVLQIYTDDAFHPNVTTLCSVICRRNSVCLSSVRLSFVCLSSVTFMHPTLGVKIFGNVSILQPNHPLTSLQNFTEIVPG